MSEEGFAVMFQRKEPLTSRVGLLEVNPEVLTWTLDFRPHKPRGRWVRCGGDRLARS